jgi:hypothetical protein
VVGIVAAAGSSLLCSNNDTGSSEQLNLIDDLFVFYFNFDEMSINHKLFVWILR